MLKKAPVEVSQEQVSFKVEEIEPFLSGPARTLPHFEPAYVELKDGNQMLIREVKDEEVPLLMEEVKKFMDKGAKDFYDIVGARIYAELLGYLRNRLKDPYLFVGAIDGEIAGFCNGRIYDDDIHISLHTMAFKRGLRVGATLYYAKMSYCFDDLGQEEMWSTFESYNGFKRWGMGMAQFQYPWPEYQHELGGARVFYVDRKYWNSTIKDYVKQMVGTEMLRPAPKELIEKNEKLVLPSDSWL
ncbi:MAG: hypothetical protein UMV23_00105 [Halanaerobium sp.]|nr:hypothetical protein [Halanaerobium sp.]